MLVALSQRTCEEQRYKERRDCLDQEWARLLGRLGCQMVALPNAATEPLALLERLQPDALILTGGSDPLPESAPDAERNRLEEAALDWAERHGCAVVGICRGMQAINQRLGGQVRPVEGHVAASHKVSTAGGGSFLVNSFHDFGIGRADLAAELEPILWGSDDTVEAASHRARPLTCLMWHPERTIAEPERQQRLLKAILSGQPLKVALG
ncbi:gamma-glutamyl-gamma-aminobutyrate hydrolase family protein [Bosea beijingensis]|uniref:gamma-glutamyl-gamma-aminobutyrate hydrolase family protein n=1 Tax=Bosea beijingensis TaxID=3068632 RepID=UPI0027407E37|nr:gamma-glutamyl-gamma-aminobutyrate hydrolase family protein [Bosea sp. REN20]